MKVMKYILSRHGLTILFTTFTVLAILAIRVVPDYVADTRNIGADEPISHHEDDFVEDPPSSYPKVAQFYPSLLPTFTKTPSLFPAVKPSMIVTKESPTAAPISANTQSTTSPTTSKTAGLQRTPDETSELITTPVLRKRLYKKTPFGEIEDVVVLADIWEEEDARFLEMSFSLFLQETSRLKM